MPNSLADRVALITGGSQGIGRAIATAFAAEGAVVAISARHGAALQQAADEIAAQGGRALPMVGDVTDAEQVRNLTAEVAQQLGPIQILVNNAGFAPSHKIVDHPDELWARVLDVNLTGVYRVTKAVVPGMIARKWGRIINIGSTASKVGSQYIAAYTASKHGVLGLTRALAVELVGHGITVNAICPGYVDTPMTDAAVANIVARTGRTADQVREFMANSSPQNRLIEPEEVAALAVMLAGDTARGITGQAINVDGGAVMF